LTHYKKSLKEVRFLSKLKIFIILISPYYLVNYLKIKKMLSISYITRFAVFSAWIKSTIGFSFSTNHKYIGIISIIKRTVLILISIVKRHLPTDFLGFHQALFYLQLMSNCYLIFVYGILFSVYLLVCKNKFIAQVIHNDYVILFLQAGILSYTGSLSFCTFLVIYYGLLYRVEVFRENYFYPNKFNTRKIIISIFKFTRRSPIRLLRFIGRTGGVGLGGIASPQGNGPNLVMSAIVLITGMGFYQFRKYKLGQYVAKTQAKQQAYETDAKSKQHAYEIDAKSRQYDRAYAEYRQDKNTWDKRSSWTRGNPPTPPVPPSF
jgi:hypothetical protein